MSHPKPRRSRRHSRLIHAGAPPLPHAPLLLDRRVPASSEAKNIVLEDVLATLWEAGLIGWETDALHARLALDEALVNAMVHGCQRDPNKGLRVRAFGGKKKWTVLVEDEGVGFREADLPDPTTPENLRRDSGRGVFLIRKLMDEVSYWRSGSALLMSKRREPEARDPQA